MKEPTDRTTSRSNSRATYFRVALQKTEVNGGAPAGTAGRAGWAVTGRCTASSEQNRSLEGVTPLRRHFRTSHATLLGALMLVVAWFSYPASAHEPVGQASFVPSHFNGQDRCHGPDTNCGGDPGDNNEGQMATDRFDGIDSLYRFRAVATPETRYFEWYHCQINGSPYFQGQCEFIGRDDTPAISTPAPGIAPVTLFELPWDIPSSAPFARHLVTAACIEGPPIRQAHCDEDTIRIHFDDSSSTSDHVLTTSGQFVNLTHGQAVPNAGFSAIAYTSADDIGRILFCLDEGTNAITRENVSPAGGCNGSPRDPQPNDSPGCQSVPSGILCWEVNVDPPDDSEFSFNIVEQDDPSAPVESGSGDCEGDTDAGGDGANSGDDCQLDKIYLTSLVSPPEGPPPPGAPGPQSACPGFEDDLRTQIIGSADHDVLKGTAERDVLCGFGGDDVLEGFGGADVLLGGPGKDQLRGQDGPDRLRGEGGRDTLGGGGGADRLDGGPQSDLCRGGGGKDREARCERP